MVSLTKYSRYFLLNPPLEEHKVLFASIYLEGKVDHWFQAHFESLEGLCWNAFVHDLLKRFSELGYDDVGTQFKRLN